MKALVLKITLFLVVNFVFAQQQTVKSTVVAFKKYGLNNVEIKAKKAKNTVYSDSLGRFSIQCNKNDVLVFNARGFQNSRVKLKDIDTTNVNLLIIENKQAYKEVVENNHMSEVKLNYCLENEIDSNNNFDRLGTIYEVIQYVYPQARITDDNAGFGTTGRQVILDARAVKSIISSPLALLVVDGIVTTDIAGITPPNVKSVKVLSAAESGHWGTRGANGVVEITLK